MYSTDKLKKKRIDYGLSVEKISLMLNISPSYYSLIENKKRKLYYSMAVQIANIFDTTPDDLFLIKKNS